MNNAHPGFIRQGTVASSSGRNGRKTVDFQ